MLRCDERFGERASHSDDDLLVSSLLFDFRSRRLGDCDVEQLDCLDYNLLGDRDRADARFSVLLLLLLELSRFRVFSNISAASDVDLHVGSGTPLLSTSPVSTKSCVKQHSSMVEAHVLFDEPRHPPYGQWIGYYPRHDSVHKHI